MEIVEYFTPYSLQTLRNTIKRPNRNGVHVVFLEREAFFPIGFHGKRTIFSSPAIGFLRKRSISSSPAIGFYGNRQAPSSPATGFYVNRRVFSSPAIGFYGNRRGFHALQPTNSIKYDKTAQQQRQPCRFSRARRVFSDRFPWKTYDIQLTSYRFP
jgi:hypothetical protein